MALILLWVGGLSFAGCIIWADVSGFSTQTVLSILVSLGLALVGWKGLDLRRRLETLKELGFYYALCGGLGVMVKLWEFAPLSWWSGLFLFIVGLAVSVTGQRLLKKRGLLLDLSSASRLTPRVVNELCERHDSLSSQAEVLKKIRLHGHYEQRGAMQTTWYRAVGRLTYTCGAATLRNKGQGRFS